jgi:hypothetical protein
MYGGLKNNVNKILRYCNYNLKGIKIRERLKVIFNSR